ncbi:MAG: SNF2-related protein, partial [Chloroflexota bacterium]|nr:SNF2-related protein [Chloroflexota bacterium]
MSFAVGSLVKARGREWVVLPESQDDLLVLRPLGGTDDEVAGIYLPLETVEPARFDLPDPARPGDYHTSKLLRDAVRLGFRSSAGPFRSFAKIAVEPRPYQLVPLLMGLKLDPVRLLIADDVGIGKTVEASLVARELIDRGEVERLAVLCPPQLAEQWQSELRDKFHIDAELVLPSTVTRLERHTRLGESLFEIYPYVIVSTDFIKSDRRRDEVFRTCPELVIVDEAHTCAFGGERRGGRHQRYELIKGLAAHPNRHLILVTATPHSGNEQAFRSLLELLDPAFADLPENLTGTANEAHRRRLAAHFVQRRRGDIQRYLDTETPFPIREREAEDEQSYKLSEDYRRLFEKVLRYARETVTDPTLGTHRQRVRWWSALALLRSLASSPAAAAATLRSRAASADTETSEEADEIGRRTVLDLVEDESVEGIDLTPGSDTGEDGADSKLRRRLLEMAREADALAGAGDNKLKKIVQTVNGLLRDGYQPIVFCRFIPTAEYVKDALRDTLPKEVQVEAVTGTLPPAEREARVAQLG